MTDTTKAICHRCHQETEWIIVHRFVHNWGIRHCLKCSECGREVPDFAFARYQEEGRVVIPV